MISRKSLLIAFLTVTTALALVSCYTLYLYFGIAAATRSMEVLLLSFGISQMSDNDVSLESDLNIFNPSRFTFYVVWANEKLYNRQNGELVGNLGGYWLAGTPVEVASFSNVTLTIFAVGVPVAEIQARNLSLSITINLDTPLPSDATLNFSEDVSLDV